MVADHQGGEHQAGVIWALHISIVMAGLVPAIYVFLFSFSPDEESKTWMPATSAGMTWRVSAVHISIACAAVNVLRATAQTPD
jgi:hypothetical protein